MRRPLVCALVAVVLAIGCGRGGATANPDDPGSERSSSSSEARSSESGVSEPSEAAPLEHAGPPPVPGPSPAVASVPTEADRRRVETIRDREMDVLLTDPEFEEYVTRGIENVTSIDEAYERGVMMGEALTVRGVARLDGNGLQRWAALRMRMAESSLDVCAGLWTGEAHEDVLTWGMAQLTDGELTEMMQLLAEAGRLELVARTPLQPDQASLTGGLGALAASLPEPDRLRFFAVLQRTSFAPEDACLVTKVIHGRLDVLDDDLRVRFLRALAVGMAQ